MERAKAKLGQVFIMLAISSFAVIALAALAVDMTTVWMVDAGLSDKAAAARDAVVAEQNAVKFSQDPHAEIVSAVEDSLAKSSFVGKATIYIYEYHHTAASKDRYIGVEVLLETGVRTPLAKAAGIGEGDSSSIAEHVDFVVHPYATARVWSPATGGIPESEATRTTATFESGGMSGNYQAASTLSSSSTVTVSRASLPNRLVQKVAASQ